jgi:hypothetical protein
MVLVWGAIVRTLTVVAEVKERVLPEDLGAVGNFRRFLDSRIESMATSIDRWFGLVLPYGLLQLARYYARVCSRDKRSCDASAFSSCRGCSYDTLCGFETVFKYQ